MRRGSITIGADATPAGRPLTALLLLLLLAPLALAEEQLEP